MEQNTSPHCLYDLKGRPQYMAYGHYKILLRDVIFLNGWRGFFEKAWLKIQQLYPRHLLKDRITLSHWSSLTQSLAAPITAALFWQTGWYKVTQFIGGVTTDDRRFFIKAYKHADDASLAKQQSDFVNHYFNTAFTIVPVMSMHDRLVIYPLLPHATKAIAADDIEKRLIDLQIQYNAQFSRALKPALDYINLNLPNLLQKSGHAELWHSVRQFLATCPPLPMVPVHGDVTTWNIFYSDQLLPVLVDYERAGWHVPFYDCWHFYCQPLIMYGKTPDLRSYIKNIHTKTQIELATLQQTALLYLLDQLAYDLQDHDDYKVQQARFQNVVAIKIKLVVELLDDLKHD